MHGTAGSVRDRILLIAALLLTPIAAAADDVLPEEQLVEKSEREILFSADLPLIEPESFQDRFEFTTKRGIEYRQTLSIGNNEFFFQVYGPLVKRKPGLKVRLNGSLAGYEFEMKGFARAKKQGINFKINF